MGTGASKKSAAEKASFDDDDDEDFDTYSKKKLAENSKYQRHCVTLFLEFIFFFSFFVNGVQSFIYAL